MKLLWTAMLKVLGIRRRNVIGDVEWMHEQKALSIFGEFMCIYATSYERQQEEYLKLENLFGTVQRETKV